MSVHLRDPWILVTCGLGAAYLYFARGDKAMAIIIFAIGLVSAFRVK